MRKEQNNIYLLLRNILIGMFLGISFLPVANSLSVDPDFDGVAAFDFIPLDWVDSNSDSNPDIGEFSGIYGLGFGYGFDNGLSDGQLITVLDMDLSLFITGAYFTSLVLPNDFGINDSPYFIGDASSIVDNRAAVPLPAAVWFFASSIIALVAARKAKRVAL